MPIRIETFAVGPFATNCYVLRGEGDCWVVDPGLGSERVVQHLGQADLTPSRIVLTHGHVDHIGGVAAVREAFEGIRLWCPQGDCRMLGDPIANLSGVFGSPMALDAADEAVEPGQVLTLADTEWLALDTSGHTPGGLSYYSAQAGVVLTGDSLFAGGIGRTDFPGGDEARLLRNIREQLLALPDPTRVLPGHGPESTIGTERAGNPFLHGA